MFLFYKDQGKNKNRHYVSLFESKFWFFNEERHANTVPQIDRFCRAISHFTVVVTDHLTMHFSLTLPVPASSCPVTAFTAGCHLHIPASLLTSSFSWLGYPLIPQVPGRVDLDCDAYSMKGVAWQCESQGSRSPLSHSFPSISPMPDHPIETPDYWVDKMKSWCYHSTV